MKQILKKILGEKLTTYLITLKAWYFSRDKRKTLKKRMTFYASFVGKGELCFDVGANVGNRIDPLLRIGAKVLAVEPQKSCYEQLTAKYGRRIILITKGLSDKTGVKKFYISNASIVSSFSEEWINSVKEKRFKKFNWDRVEEVEMTTLDNLIAEYGVPVFIKIDVEGYELEVLKGLSSPIRMISFEYTTPEQTMRAVDCITQIENTNSKIECNYSYGESMEFAMTDWLSATEMKKQILSKQIIEAGFGDIYVRTKQTPG